MSTEHTTGPICSRILVGVDGSPPSLGALCWAARLAEMTGASLHLVTTWEWPTSTAFGIPLPDTFDPSGDVAKAQAEIVATLQAEHPTVAVTTEVVNARPGLALVERSKSADLLVLGNRGHGEIVGVVIGSVSAHYAAKSHCTVVVYRDEGHADTSD